MVFAYESESAMGPACECVESSPARNSRVAASHPSRNQWSERPRQVKCVLRVGGGEVARIDDLRGLVERIQRGAHLPGVGGGDADQAVKRIVGEAGGVAGAGQGTVDRREVALVVVGERAHLVERTAFLRQPVQGAEHAASGMAQGAVDVAHVLLGAVAHRVQGVVDLAAGDILDSDPAGPTLVVATRQNNARRNEQHDQDHWGNQLEHQQLEAILGRHREALMYEACNLADGIHERGEDIPL